MIKPSRHSWAIHHFIVALALILPALTENVASAATYYVATSGNDANPGTSSQPFRTIQKGADVVNPGDTVIVRDGVYTGAAGANIVYMTRGGTSVNWVTFKAENKWGARIDGQRTAHAGLYASGSSGGYIRLEGFEIVKIATVNGASAIFSYASNVEIVGNHIYDIGGICTDTGLGITGAYITGDNIIVEHNVIHDVGRLDAGEGGCNPSTSNYQNHDHGLYIDGANGARVRNNIFYNCKNGWCIQVYPNSVDDLRIFNNTFVFPNPYREGHITLSSVMSNSLIENNIFYQPSTAVAIRHSAGTLTNVQVRNNLIYSGTIWTGSTTGVTFSSNLDNTNPQFVNVGANNFHLTAGSPAKDAGLALAEVAIDLDGLLRPQGSAYDIGAYEFTLKDGTPPAAPRGLRSN